MHTLGPSKQLAWPLSSALCVKMKIYSNEDEVSIQGVATELQALAKEVLNLHEGESKIINAKVEADPKPYEMLLSKIKLSCGNINIKSSVSNEVLNIAFPESAKEIVASYFSYFTNESTQGEHLHFDKYGNEEYMDQESIDVVIGVEL